MSSPKCDFYGDMEARHKFLKDILDRLCRDINAEVLENNGRNFIFSYFVGKDRANISFLEKNRDYDGKIVCGVRVRIKSEHQTPPKSNKFPYGC